MSDITTLRDALFATLAGLKDGSVAMDKAKAINETAQTIINVAKVEVDFMKASDQINGSGFFVESQKTTLPALTNRSQGTANGVKHVESVAGGTVTTHRMR